MVELRKFEGELKIKSSHMSHIRIDVSDTSSLSQLKGGRGQWVQNTVKPRLFRRDVGHVPVMLF